MLQIKIYLAFAVIEHNSEMLEFTTNIILWAERSSIYTPHLILS